MKIKSKKSNLTVTEISDTYTYVSSKNFTFQLGDEKSRTFGILFEITDMLDATGDGLFEQYPFVVSAQLMVNKPNKSFYEGDGKHSPSELMIDTVSYMGGVPIDHVLANDVNGGLKDLVKNFTLDEACLITSKNDYGTIAAQKGRGVKHQYLQFKTEDAANKYIELLTDRAGILSTMIGFILDRPINMIGDSGWSVFEKQVKGCK